jgi:hypothetical protein
MLIVDCDLPNSIDKLNPGYNLGFCIPFYVVIKMKTISLKNLAHFFEKRMNEEKHIVYYVHAATLKNERRRLDMTLEEVTSNICSKSYASKIENNLLAPDPNIIRLLFEKVNINYDKLMSMEVTNNLSQCMKYYLYRQKDKIKEVYLNVTTEFFIARDSLIKLLYLLTTKQFNEFSYEVESLDEIKSSLNDYELLMLMFCTIEFYILNHQFIDADKYLNIIKNMPFDDAILKALFYEQRFIVACNLHQLVKIYRYYEDIRNEYKLGYPMKQQFYTKILFLEAFCDNYETLQEFENMLNDYIPEEYRDDFYYSQCITLLKMHNFEEAIKCIINNNFCEPRFIALLGYCVKTLQEQNREIIDLDQYLSIFMERYKSMEYDGNDTIHLNFIKLMNMEINNVKQYEIFDYLKNYLVVNLSMYQHRFYSIYYSIKYLSMLGNHSRYKEAYNFSKSDPNLLKNNLFKFTL